MRFIDVTLATSFALVSVAILAGTSPLNARQQTAQMELNLMARAGIDHYLENYPLQYLATTGLQSFCLSLAENSNQSLILSGELNGETCSLPARLPASLGSATMNIRVVGRDVKIKAWTTPRAR